jgi:hypothetical protein
MSLGLIPYQPLPFGLEANCTLPCSNWTQKIQKSDATSIQFTYRPCGTTYTVIDNGDFANDSADWTFFGDWDFTGSAAVSPPNTMGYLSQSLPDMGVDYLEVSFNLVLNVGVFTFDYNGTLVTYNSSGFKSIIIPLSGATTLTFTFDSALGGSISNIIAKPINANVRLDVFDLADTYIDTVPTSFFTYSDGFFTATFDWASLALADGCYKLAVYDPCECSQFGFVGDNFLVPNQFRTITGSAVYGVGVITSLGTGPVQTQVRSRALFCPDVEYTVEYTVSGLDTGAGDYFQFRFGSTNGIQRTVDGTYSETITTSFTGDIESRFIFNHGLGGSVAIELSDFSISAVEPIVTYESVQFDLREVHKCSVLVEACGVGQEFNFGFNGTGFKPVVRLESTYRTANYPTTRTDYEYSTGRKVVPYMRTRQAKTLLFGSPEYIHDFARILLGLSNVYINGDLMFCEDSEPPTVSWEDDIDFGIVTFTFSKQTELTEKTSCESSPNTGCAVGGGYYLNIRSTGGTVKDWLPILATAEGVRIRFGI